MKFGILVALISTLSVPAFAAELCGTVSSHPTGPTCVKGRPCPQWMGIGYEITPMETGAKPIQLGSATLEALQDLEAVDGQLACVTGKESGDSFEVESTTTFAPRQALEAKAVDGTPVDEASSGQIEVFASGDTSLTIIGESAKIQFTCGSVTIADWHSDGKAMVGMDHPGPISAGPGTPARVTAHTQNDGTIKVVVGKGSGGTYVFSKGQPTHTGLRCL